MIGDNLFDEYEEPQSDTDSNEDNDEEENEEDNEEENEDEDVLTHGLRWRCIFNQLQSFHAEEAFLQTSSMMSWRE